MSFPRYERYKDSRVEWLGEVPESWQVQTLKNVVATPITDGPHETPEFCSEGVPFVSAEAVSTGRLDFTKIRGFISDVDHRRYAEKYLPRRNDIFMVKSGATTGVTAIVDTDDEFNIWSPLAAIRCNAEVNPRFMLHFLRSRNFLDAVSLNWSFGTQQNIGMGVIENLSILVPPIEEQDRIALILDWETAKIDALIEEQRRLIALLKEKRQAVISHAVTKGLNRLAKFKDSNAAWLGSVPAHWTMKRLRGLFHQEKRQNFPDRLVLSVYRDHGVVPKDSREDNTNKTPEDLSAYQLVEREDLVVNKMKAWQGSLGISAFDGITSPDYIVFKPHHTELSSFLHLLLRSQKMVSVYRGISNGIRPAQWRLEPEPFLGLPIFLPPLQEQEDIVSYLVERLSQFDSLTKEAGTAINLLQERRSVLISAAVTGKIDVRNYSPRETPSHEEVYEPA
jgi:type I restriction enzyme S subunit